MAELTMKMPEPIIDPTTSAVASRREMALTNSVFAPLSCAVEVTRSSVRSWFGGGEQIPHAPGERFDFAQAGDGFGTQLGFVEQHQLRFGEQRGQRIRQVVPEPAHRVLPIVHARAVLGREGAEEIAQLVIA